MTLTFRETRFFGLYDLVRSAERYSCRFVHFGLHVQQAAAVIPSFSELGDHALDLLDVADVNAQQGCR
jgi:hypothetical protein